MKIIVLIDAETVFPDDPEFTGAHEQVRAGMEFHIIKALRESNHEISILPFGPDPLESVRAIVAGKPDLVFNLTEHFRGNRRQDANIAGLLELMDIPFTGTGAEGLLLCRDKVTAKRLLGYHKIRLPHFFSVPPGSGKIPPRPHFPLIVKPALEDGSDGISLASIVRDVEELNTRIKMIHERMSQPALCEEYIEGREIYVGITGNERLTAYPAREIRFGKTAEGGPQIATAKVKVDEEYRKKWEIAYQHADLPPHLERLVGRVSKRIYRILQIRDYGRIDLRMTATGEIVFLEANPNPNLARDEDLAEAAHQIGIDHPALIDRILKMAQQRYRKNG
jgi:D-alanine-D-alanine ligase